MFLFLSLKGKNYSDLCFFFKLKVRRPLNWTLHRMRCIRPCESLHLKNGLSVIISTREEYKSWAMDLIRNKQT